MPHRDAVRQPPTLCPSDDSINFVATRAVAMMKSAFMAVLASFVTLNVHAADWSPVVTTVNGRQHNYFAYDKAPAPWRICVLIPNAIDKFWWGVGWSLNDDAKRLQLKLGLYDAGGYDHVEKQRMQFQHCIARKADAIIVAPVTPTGLNQEITAAIAKGVVVIDMINRVEGVETTAHSAANAAELSRLASHYLLKDAAKRQVSVAWLPGPQGADWVVAAEEGVRPLLNHPSVQLIRAGCAAPDVFHQMALVRRLFEKNPPDYILANAPAAEAAARFLDKSRTHKTRVISYYLNEPVFDFIKSGLILASASNSPATQAHLALDLAVRALERASYPKDVQVVPEMIDAKNIDALDTDKVFPPARVWIGLRELPD